MNRNPQQSGFTTIELGISGAVFGMIILLGVEASRSALNSTFSSVQRSERTQSMSRSFKDLGTQLTSAGISTLVATPAGSGSVPEAMQDGVSYNNVSFRRAIGFADGNVVYDPPAVLPELKISYLAWDPKRPKTTGVVSYFDGARTHILHTKVTALSVVKNGSQLAFSITPYSGQEQSTPLTFGIVIRSP